MQAWRGAAAIAGALILGGALGPAAGARAESRQVVIYSANESVLDNLVFSAFEKETGITVQPVETGSGILMKRVATEKDRPQGDVVWGISRSLLETSRAYFQPYRSQHRDAIPAEFRDPDDLWIGNNLHLLVILQNTKQVAPGQGPHGWSDLLDPAWRGKIAFTDPANSGSAFTNTTFLAELWGPGEPGWTKVASFLRNTKMLNKSSLVFQGVGNGEYPLGVSLEYAGYVWASNGAPVSVIYPSDGTVVAMEGCAILKGGPNPDSAKRFVDFINRKDVRELIFAKTFRRPARQDLDFSKLPGGMPPLSAIKLVSYDEAAWTAKRAATMAKIQDLIEQTR
jgi:iron(III) transport system substrate-binding protein